MMMDQSKRRPATWLLSLGFWTLLALSYTLSSGLSSIGEGRDPDWTRALAWNFSNDYLWWLLVPLVGWLGRRTGQPGWRRFWAVHLPASVLVAAVQTLAMLAIFWQLCGPGRMPARTLGDFLRMELAYTVHLSLLTYWIVLAVLRGLESRRRLRDERLRSARLETQLAQSQLQTLRMQLQPHFLFNTLNAISALAQEQPTQARLMIARLSDLLRLTLEERHAQCVPLSRELELLEAYLAIQRVRFQDRLRIEVDVGPDTTDARVPNMILQPLVENALRHGLLDRPRGGTLRIVTRRHDTTLHLRVDDDGHGLPRRGLTEGIGLGTTRARLEALFGPAGQLALDARPHGGTRAELRFPFQVHAP